MSIYLVSLGNSDDGPIGAAARVHGRTAKDAVANLQKMIPNDMVVSNRSGGTVESLRTFVNADFITADMIVKSETEPCDRENCPYCTKPGA
jgi:hypothetical protein